ncbi:MAG: hypothetical protein JNN12_15835 [Bacteroidetes Order II. Incertae sedis bacterium]|nr:hypothetical protein [Bacteroidetes Order II. bacterium]
MSKWFFLLLLASVVAGCDSGELPCDGFECEIAGKWDIHTIDGTAGHWGTLEVYKSKTGGRLTFHSGTAMPLLFSAFGGGYWGDDDLRLSLWNLTMPDGRLMSFETGITQWAKDAFTLRVTKSAGDNPLAMLNLGRIWELKRQ